MRRSVDALPVTARTVPSPVIAVAVLAIAAIVNALRGGHDFAGALTAASIIAGAGAGYIADDPAAPTLESSPTPLGTGVGVEPRWLRA